VRHRRPTVALMRLDLGQAGLKGLNKLEGTGESIG
jgi:hypothetical protein